MKTVEQLSLNDLNSIAKNKSLSIAIWGEEVLLSSIYFYKDNDQIAPFFNKIIDLLSWLDKNRKAIIKGIIKKGFIKIAEEWASEANNRIKTPIAEDEFCNSLDLSEVGFCIGDIHDEPSANIYLTCSPDYFSGHAICCYLKMENNNIQYEFVLEG